MLWPPSYFFRRSCASLSRSAPVMRLPFLSSATCSSVSLKQSRTSKDLLKTDLHLPRVTRATRMDGPVATVRFVLPPDEVASSAPEAHSRPAPEAHSRPAPEANSRPAPEAHPATGTGRHPEAKRQLSELGVWL